MLKKASTLFMLLLFLFSYASIAEANSAAEVYSEGIECEPGGTAKLTVNIKGNPGIAGFKIFLDYNPAVFSAPTVTPGEVLAEQATLLTLGPKDADTCQVVWAAMNDVTADGALFTVEFQVAANAASGDYPIYLDYEPRDAINASREKVAFTFAAPPIVTVAGANSAAEVFSKGIECKPGGTAKLTVNIKDNPSIAGFKFFLDYNPAVFCAPAVAPGEVLAEQAALLTLGPKDADTCQVVWAAMNDVTADGALFTVEFQVAANAAAGDYPIYLDYEPRDAINASREKVAFTFAPPPIVTVEPKSDAPTVSGQVQNYDPKTDDTVTVAVSLENNPGLAAFEVYVDYDQTALTLNQVQAGDLLRGGTFTPNLTGNTEHDLSCAWQSPSNITGDGVLFTMEFTVNSAIDRGAYPLILSHSPSGTVNAAGEPLSLDLRDGFIFVNTGDSDPEGIAFTITEVAVPQSGSDRGTIKGNLSGLDTSALSASQIISAVYDERGQLRDVSVQSAANLGARGAWSAELQLPEGGYYIKIFLLDSAGGFRPLV